MSDTAASPEFETAEERLARHSAMLQRLQALAMGVAEAVARRTEIEAAAGELDGGAAALALGRAAKAVRQSIALENKLHQDLADRAREDQAREDRAREDRAREDRAREASSDPAHAAEDHEAARQFGQRTWSLYRKDKIHDVVEKAIATEREPVDRERLLADLDEWLEDEDAAARLAAVPVAIAIQMVCAGLGLKPDWSLWKRQTWAIESALPGVPRPGPPSRGDPTHDPP